MRRLRDPNHVPISPKFWTDPKNGHKEQWRSDREPFEAFMQRVMDYCEANGREKPSREALEDELCRQMPSWACVGQSFHTAAQRAPAQVIRRATGCASCGKRR